MQDPDGGIQVLKKKAEAGRLVESTPNDEANIFPKDGYNLDLSKVPKVTFGTVWKFMIEKKLRQQNLWLKVIIF